MGIICNTVCFFLERIHENGGFLKRVGFMEGNPPLILNFFENAESTKITSFVMETEVTLQN